MPFRSFILNAIEYVQSLSASRLHLPITGAIHLEETLDTLIIKGLRNQQASFSVLSAL